MIWFVIGSVYLVISYSTVPATGQCTVSSCTVSLSGCEESLQVSLEEHGHRLEAMNQNMRSAFEKFEEAVNRTNTRGQEELWRDLKMLSYNMSINFDSLNEKIPEMFEGHSTKEREEYFRYLNLSLTSSTVRTEVRIEAVSEDLQNINRSLDEKFQVMQVQLQSQSSELQTVNRSLDEKLQVMQVQLQDQYSTIQTANRNLDYKVQVMNESVVSALRDHDQKLQTMNETLLSAIDQINEKLNAILDHVDESRQHLRCQDYCRNASVVCDCSDIKANGCRTSGVYLIYVDHEGKRYYINASCDMTTTNKGWTVFQRREDGSVNFSRDWNDYEHGFGNPNGEFWLGNKFVHMLTSKRRYRVRIDLEDFEGGQRYAEYSIFNISSSADKYRLRLGTYSGTAGDSLPYNNGKRFSTIDSDNDASSSTNCAVELDLGAWWHGGCDNWSNLNGLYRHGSYPKNITFGIYWFTWHSAWYSLKTTEIKITSF